MTELPGSVAILLASALFAASPIATVTAPPDLRINGKTVQTAGAPTWPLSIGDELITAASKAVISFPDGVSITMAPDTKVVLQSCDRCIVQLFQGAVDYSKPSPSKLELCALGHRVRPAPGTQGSVVIESAGKVVVKVAGKEQVTASGKCSCNAGAPWAKGGLSAKQKAAIVIIPAGATAAAVAVTRPSPTSSK